MRRAIATLGICTLIGCHHHAPARDAEMLPQDEDSEPRPPVSACADAKDPLHPMIVEWPVTSRTELETSAAKGPVVVSYGGCVLKVLSSCHVSGVQGYEVEGKAPLDNQIDIANEHDLRRELPLGIANLKGQLGDGSRLLLSYVTVGTRVLHQVPTVLEGDCAGATHYVASMDLGAFSLFAKHATSADATTRIGPARTTTHADVDKEIGGSAGDLAACHAHGAACEAILALGLAPLPVVGGRTAGFGRDLPAPIVVPTMPAADLGKATAGSDPAHLDLTLLELVQAARDIDGRETIDSVAKAEAWDRVARYAPAVKVAADRRDAWHRHAEAEDARDRQVVELCARYHADRSKLARLKSLGDGVLSAVDKHDFGKEFEAAYAPWPEVEDCTMLHDSIVARTETWPALHGANDGMVHVQGGSFMIGSDVEQDEALPPHRVTLDAFEIDATEVTVAAYARCEHAGACSHRITYVGEDGYRCNAANVESRDRAAANCMTYGQAAAYCHWAKKRLPTEEEWEYAARGPDSRRYPWGEWEKDRSTGYDHYPYHYCASPGGDLGYIAGSIAANTSYFGARDMAGGVWEWTTSKLAKAKKDHVLRGGELGWSSDASCKLYPSAYRLKHVPDYADSNLGARCVR